MRANRSLVQQLAQRRRLLVEAEDPRRVPLAVVGARPPRRAVVPLGRGDRVVELGRHRGHLRLGEHALEVEVAGLGEEVADLARGRRRAERAVQVERRAGRGRGTRSSPARTPAGRRAGTAAPAPTRRSRRRVPPRPRRVPSSAPRTSTRRPAPGRRTPRGRARRRGRPRRRGGRRAARRHGAQREPLALDVEGQRREAEPAGGGSGLDRGPRPAGSDLVEEGAASTTTASSSNRVRRSMVVIWFPQVVSLRSRPYAVDHAHDRPTGRDQGRETCHSIRRAPCEASTTRARPCHFGKGRCGSVERPARSSCRRPTCRSWPSTGASRSGWLPAAPC